MKKLLLYIGLASAILSGCREKTNTKNVNLITGNADQVTNIKKKSAANQSTKQDFLSSLEDICVEDDGVFKNCDELFSKDGSALFFLIIPKAGAQKWYETESKNLSGAVYEKNNALIAKVKSIGKGKLSKDFDVWVFYTDKMYTQRVNMDAAYNVKNPHSTELYYLNSGKNDWQKQDSFQVQNDNDVQREIQWKDNFINKATTQSNQKVIKTTGGASSVSAQWNGKYSAYFSYGEIAGQNAGWTLEIIVTDNKITASGDGYQIAFLDELTGTANKGTLILRHYKNLSGYKKGATMNNSEFKLLKDNGRFYVQSEWIDTDVTNKPDELGYVIERTDL